MNISKDFNDCLRFVFRIRRCSSRSIPSPTEQRNSTQYHQYHNIHTHQNTKMSNSESKKQTRSNEKKSQFSNFHYELVIKRAHWQAATNKRSSTEAPTSILTEMEPNSLTFPLQHQPT